MKYCNDASLYSKLFKSLTPAPQEQQFDWSKFFITTFLVSEKYVF